MIHLDQVSKTYQRANGPVHALTNVTLDIAPGQFVAVRGPSGCGKSTLLTIVGGLAMPTSGTVRVAGADVLAMSPAERARFRAENIGFVFQMFHLLPYLSVLENVAAAAIPGTEAEATKRAGETLDRFQLAHRLHHRPDELSTGECQRVAIARALVNRPRLILADEPTGNLDAENAASVLDLLTDFHRDGGSVLLVTHEEPAAARAERTISLRHGSIESN
jgi:putative ABC transport system ATP-binding protein